MKATSTNATAGNGLFPIGGTFTVQPGDRYRIRFKGYRNGHAAYLQVKAGAAVLSSPGTALPNSAATESWIEQLVTIPAGITTMQVGVVWGVVSLNEFMLFNELEIDQLTSNAPEYQYNLKDHLGNVRVTFTTAPATQQDVATYEDANMNVEQSKFLRYANARRINATIFDHTNGNNPGYSERLSGNTNEIYGLARSISVMPGDVVTAEVYAKYVDTNSSNWTTALATLMGQIAANTAGVVVDGTSYSTSTSSFPAFTGVPAKTNDTGGPKAYLNWLVFDKNYNLILTGTGYAQMTTAAKETGSDVPHERLFSPQITITQPGYVYIYLSNENPTPVEVYFDDFKVTQINSPVVQTEDFYPFGLAFNLYSRENTVTQSFLYNGKEQINDLAIDWYDYGARMYMPEIGRWGVVDPLADRSRRWSPYTYAYDNPIRFIDVDGMYSSEFGADSQDYESMKDRANEFMQESQVGNEENAQTDDHGNTVHSSDIAASFNSNDYQFGADGTSRDDDPNPDANGDGPNHDHGPIDLAKAIANLNAIASAPYGKGKCAANVINSLVAGGAVYDVYPSGIPYAYKFGPTLEDMGLKAVDVKSLADYTPVAGDVVMLQPWTANNNVSGHMQMYNGTAWVSDYDQGQNFYPWYNPNSLAMPSFTIYRYTPTNP